MKARETKKSSGSTSSDDSQAGLHGSKLRLFGVALLGAKIALVPLGFDQAFDLPFSVTKALLSHALAYALAGVLAGLLIRQGPAFFVWSWLHVPVLAFLAANALATVFAADPVLALYGSHQRMLGLGTIADLVLLYFAIVLLVRTRRDVITLVGCALGASVLVLGYEALQLAGGDPFQWNIDSTERPFSTIGQSTSLAQYLATLGLGVFALSLLVDGLNRVTRSALMLYSGVLLVGALATGTRSELIGVVSGSIFLFVCIWRGRSRLRVIWAVLLGASLVTAGLTLVFVPSFISARLAGTIERLQADSDQDLLARLEPSGADRSALFQIGLSMFRERPLLGYGPDNFAAGVPRYRPERAHPQIQQSLATSEHSWLIHLATGTGIFGLTTFLGIVTLALVLTLRRGLHTFAVAAGAMLASFLGTGLTTVNDLGTEWLLWSALGMIALSTAEKSSGIDPSPRRSDTRSTRHRTRSGRLDPRTLAAGSCVAAGILLTSIPLTPAIASRLIHTSQTERLIGSVSRAIESGLAATRADASRAAYWDVLGLAYVAAERWRDAGLAFERAMKLAPYDVRYIGDLARVQLVLANAGETSARTRALQLGDQAVQTDPNNPRAHLTRAVVRQFTNDIPQAVQSVDRALSLDPKSTNDQLYVTGTQVMVASGRPNDAVAIARNGLLVLGQTRQSVALRIELARALAAAGQRSEAIAELDLALAIWPNEPSAERLRMEIRAGIRN